MADMVVSASTGVMSSLLSKLSTLLSDKYKQLKGVRRDIEFLSRELAEMNAALEKLADMEELDAQRKLWRDNVREMAYNIEDCIDIFMNKIDQGDDKASSFHKTARQIRNLRVRHQLASKIQELKDQVLEQSERRHRYKIDESSTTSTVKQVDPRVRALFEDAKRLVGIDGPKEKITQWLMQEGDGESGELKVVSIVGFGGLGKTTLANQVYCKVKNHFDCTAFVSVSRNPDMLQILKEILSAVGYRSTDIPNNISKLIFALKEHLADKRYLLIIDDIWNTEAWDTIKCAFVQNHNGSRVITTTRIRQVATACCLNYRGHLHDMQPLNEIDSRRLFFKRVFGTEDCPENFRAIAEDMLKKCKGVPLAITSIASLLASQGMDVEEWEKTRDSLGSEMEKSGTLEWMRHVLSISYNDLSHDLKTCLLYLGIYPEDYAIDKSELVRRWIAEGFVRGKHGLDLEEVAESNFNELINRNMIQPSINKYDEVSSCRVHDLMLDVIISKCTEENFMAVIDRRNNINGASQVRRISHQFNNRDMAPVDGRVSLSQVRSYTSFPASDYMAPLSKFEVMRVLALDNGNIISENSELIDLTAIDHLFLLRYLKVRAFRVKLPKKFGKLKHLMVLDLAFVGLGPYGATDVTSLSSLRHLTLPYGRSVELRNGLSKLCNLRTLSNFHFMSNSEECIRGLSELINLRELTFVLPRVNEHSDTTNLKLDILAASVEKLGNSNLRTLDVIKFSSRSEPPTWFWSKCFTCPSHLRKLRMNHLIKQLPDWMARAEKLAYVDGLQVQELRSDVVQALAQLPCLIYLELFATRVSERPIIILPNTYRSLKNFELCCSEFACLTFETGAMPRLRRLSITLWQVSSAAVQPQGDSPIAGVEHLVSLEEISVTIWGKSSKTESACRDAINRHPRSHALRIHLKCNAFGGN
ncbi:hypothetical protein ACP4OV_006906 [Aristida adscensionis]